MAEARARVLAGRYELGPLIGRGGMAEIYRGRDRSLDRDVAVKVIIAGASRERFLAEARRTAQIRHPAIVEVFDVGFDQDPFLVMALLEGESLQARLQRDHCLSAQEVVTIAVQICDALGAAHAAGVVHRDIKPANVFLPLTKRGEETHVKVLDFGVAKRIDGKTVETDPGVLLGTVAYMAPEQIQGGELDGRADLYSLGVLVYRCLCGRLPFERDNMASLIHAHLRVAAPALTGLGERPELARLDGVVRGLLAKSPGERPADAAAARAALRAAVDTRPPELSLPALTPTVLVPNPPLAVPEVLESPAPAPVQEGPISFEVDTGPLVAAVPYQGFSGPPAPASIERVAYQPAPPRGLFARIPTSISKRVAGYAALVLVLHVFFFRVNSTAVVVVGAISMLGLIAYLGAKRA